MKQRTLFFGLAALVFTMVSCHEAPIGEDFADKQYSPLGAVISPSNVQVGFFDLGDPPNSKIGFDLDVKGESVSSVEVMAAFNNGGETAYTTLNALPAQVEVTMDDILSAFNFTLDDVAVGDEVLFTFDATTANGRFRSSEILKVPFSCLSELAGSFDYVSESYFCTGDPLTGTVVLSESGAGKYVFDDWSFGAYQECYGGSASSWGSIELVDVCNKLSVSGMDSYGDSWVFAIQQISGPELKAMWSNTYGEFGTVTLTATDGRTWPPLSN